MLDTSDTDNTYFPHLSRWRHQSGQHWRVGLPLVAIVLIVAGAVVALLFSRELERERRAAQMISDTLWAEQALGFEAHRMIESIQVLSRDLEMETAADAHVFERRAAELLQRNTEIRLLCRVDASQALGRCFPRAPNGPAGQSALWHEVLDRSLRLDRPEAMLWPDAPEPGTLLVSVPAQGGELGSALVAMVSLSQLLNETLPWWFAHDNEVRLTDVGGAVLAVRDPGVKGRGIYTHQMQSEIAGQTFLLNANSTRGIPRVVPNALTGAVVGLSLLLAWCVWALWRDLMRRTRAEAALREQQAVRQAMENSLMSGLRARDLDGRIIYANPAFCEMVGYRPEELIGHVPPMAYWAPENAEQSLLRHEQLLARTLSSEAYESIYVRRDGTRLTVLVSEAPLLDGDGQQTGWMASIMDITEQKRAQEFQRLQDERMNHMSRLMTMGEMASALAHELNQPLAAINSYCSAASNLLDSTERDAAAGRDVDGDIYALVSKARVQSERAGQIIGRVHDFVRKVDPTLVPLALDEVVRELLPLVRLQTSRRGEAVQVQVDAGLPPVLADRVLLEQVLLNLTRNAFEAMSQLPPAARRVLITIEALQGDECSRLRVAVRDWGHGLIDNARQALESPFFTTKPHGMGMGLAVCRSALESMCSHLRYEALEAGARFYFDLPVSQAGD